MNDSTLTTLQGDSSQDPEGRIRELMEENRELKEENEALRKGQMEDVVTGLVPRRFALILAGKLLAIAQRDKKSFAALFIDLDHFKEINDAHGHAAGDLALKSVGQVLRDSKIRESDVFACLGGDEMACFLPETDESGALIKAERILDSIRALQIEFEGQTISVTPSIGIAIWRSGESLDDLTKRADMAMYAAKDGRNQVRVWSKDMTMAAE